MSDISRRWRVDGAGPLFLIVGSIVALTDIIFLISTLWQWSATGIPVPPGRDHDAYIAGCILGEIASNVVALSLAGLLICYGVKWIRQHPGTTEPPGSVHD